MGFSVIDLDPIAGRMERLIVEWTRKKNNPNDPDNRVAVDWQVGGHLRFSNTLMGRAGEPVDTQFFSTYNTTWDPPNEIRPTRGLSQYTYFDEGALSSRDEDYRAIAVDWFAEYVYGSYLARRSFFIDPTPQVKEVLGDTPPNSREAVIKLTRHDPPLLQYLHCTEHIYTRDEMSSGLRQACQALLESRDSLKEYLADSKPLLEEWGGEMSEREREAFERATQEKAELIQHAYDSVELGRAPGDENTYILIGVDRSDPKKPRPHPGGLKWLNEQMAAFADLNGFVPAFGCFVSEARTRFRVIAGPGVGGREIGFLKFFGHEVIDHTRGEAIGRLDGDGSPGGAQAATPQSGQS